MEANQVPPQQTHLLDVALCTGTVMLGRAKGLPNYEYYILFLHLNPTYWTFTFSFNPKNQPQTVIPPPPNFTVDAMLRLASVVLLALAKPRFVHQTAR